MRKTIQLEFILKGKKVVIEIIYGKDKEHLKKEV